MLVIENLSKQFGPQQILQHAELFIGPHDRAGLIGPNGAGKTTLFRIIVGEESGDGGSVRLESHRTAGILTQESQCRLGITVREEMWSAFKEAQVAQSRIESLAEQMPEEEGFEQREVLRQMSKAQGDLEREEAHTAEARIGKVLHGLGFEKGALNRMTDEFSGGWQMRIAMAKLLLRQPDLLLLDEPTNHLDAAAKKWLQDYLQSYHGAVFIISHDPIFLEAVVDRIVELEHGLLTSYTGSYKNYHRVKEESRMHQQAAYERQQRELERQQEFINRFGAKATKASQVKSREKQLDKMEKIEAPRPVAKAIAFNFPKAPEPAQEVLRLKDISKIYGKQVVLLGVNLKLKRGARIALTGPNGAGKSTLLRLMAGIEPPTEGSREEGRQLLIGYFAQHQAEALDPGRTVLQEVLYGLTSQPEGVARGLLGRLLIRGDEVYKPVKVLSGGERSRVALAKFLMRPSNLLLLDEPTNHLDPASRQVLHEALTNFAGTLVIASHDRALVQAVATESYQLEDGVLVEKRAPAPTHAKKKGIKPLVSMPV